MAGENDIFKSEQMAASGKDPAGSRRRAIAKETPRRAVGIDGSWTAPVFSEGLRSRIGGSVVIQIVLGHSGADVFRELVQNEFDAGGDSLTIAFGEQRLDVVGNGRGVDEDGWKRLDLILGTGQSFGEGAGEDVAAKHRRIGSKNFGMRSLFLFGDDIFVYSNGYVSQLNLPEAGTTRMTDTTWLGESGIRQVVPYRSNRYDILDAFEIDGEKRIFDAMAGGLFATLIKLALVGPTSGLRKLTLSSVRLGRVMDWSQKAVKIACDMKDVEALRRTGRLKEKRAEGESVRSFEEQEFSRAISIPSEFADQSFPEYFSSVDGFVHIGVSVAMRGRRIDVEQTGHFYYPLQARDARTGAPISVVAPFEMNAERSNIIENDWNRWLISQAVDLTMDLLKEDWFRRFGADAFRAVIFTGPEADSPLGRAIKERLSKDACWPTRSSDADSMFDQAENLIIVQDPILDYFFWDNDYLHDGIQTEKSVCELARQCGSKIFAVSSLVWLRSSTGDGIELKSKIDEKKSEAAFSYGAGDEREELSKPDRQETFAHALTVFRRKLSKENLHDLRTTPSTLTTLGELKPAEDLFVVAADIWDACPVPPERRLHPTLVQYAAVSALCQAFDEEAWIIDVCARAQHGVIDDTEREVLYSRILTRGHEMSRKALAAVRSSPVMKSAAGAWVAPADMVLLKGQAARLMASVVAAPAKKMLANKKLVQKLRLRERINGADIVACARSIDERPDQARYFEGFLKDNIRSITAIVADELEDVPFLVATSGDLGSPSGLHVNSEANRICLNDDSKIVAGKNEALYRRLCVQEDPDLNSLLAVLLDHSSRSRAVQHPAIFYRALAGAVSREPERSAFVAGEAILVVDATYRRPVDVIVSPDAPAIFDGIIPVYRDRDDLASAYRDLGAASKPTEAHWARVFSNLAARFGGGLVGPSDRRLFEDAYRLRGGDGLPEGIGDHLSCLMADDTRLFSLASLASGRLVENDFPRLGDALRETEKSIGLVTPTERTRKFFDKLGLSRLSRIAIQGGVFFGEATAVPGWVKPHHHDNLLKIVKGRVFAVAVHELRQRLLVSATGKKPVGLAELRRRLQRLAEIRFFSDISREYSVSGVRVQVREDVAIDGEIIGVVHPRAKMELFQLVAIALAELAGAGDEEDRRRLSIAIMPLFQCYSDRDVYFFLDHQGIRLSEAEPVADDGDGFDDIGPADVDLALEDTIRDMVQDLGVSGAGYERASVGDVQDVSSVEVVGAEHGSAFELPPIDDVFVTVAAVTYGQTVHRVTNDAGVLAGGRKWTRRTSAEMERDNRVGERGEMIVYRQELERVRAMGYANPEEIVIWTSRLDPGADHDIRSVSGDGKTLWIEVKSTSGRDGNFDWSAKEFKKAMREKENYELVRVYLASSTWPVVKRFPNPASMLGTSDLDLEIGGLRASIEGLKD